MENELLKIKLEAQTELAKLTAASPAKEVAGKAIGTYGLPAIVVIVIIGVLASLQLDEGKMAAVMGLLGASLTALISMLNSIAGANTKEEKPEFEVMKQLIERLDKMADRDPMSVQVDGGKVTVRKGEEQFTSGK